jgi:hypothetical protein
MQRAALAGSLLVPILVACNTSPKITQDAPTTPTSVSTTAPTAATAATVKPASGTSASTSASGNGVRVIVAPQDSDAISVVRTERLRAKAEGRVLVVYAGAGWCEPCKRFKHAVETGTLDEKLPQTTLLVFDADRDTDRLGAAGYKFSFIPYVALPGADGHPSDTAEARAKGSESWRELVAKLESWQARGP